MRCLSPLRFCAFSRPRRPLQRLASTFLRDAVLAAGKVCGDDGRAFVTLSYRFLRFRNTGRRGTQASA